MNDKKKLFPQVKLVTFMNNKMHNMLKKCDCDYDLIKNNKYLFDDYVDCSSDAFCSTVKRCTCNSINFCSCDSVDFACTCDSTNLYCLCDNKCSRHDENPCLSDYSAPIKQSEYNGCDCYSRSDNDLVVKTYVDIVNGKRTERIVRSSNENAKKK